MDKNSKIFVAGSNGLVGSAIVRRLQSGGYTNLLTPEIDEIDLTDQKAVASFFAAERPEYVFLAAAMVGGIHANNTYRQILSTCQPHDPDQRHPPGLSSSA